MGEYVEFENLCFVDTLDNTGFHWVGKQGDLFGVSAENAARIRKQNERKISVIIGNPPYNAKQENYNFQNANRTYKDIDKRIKETYIKYGSAQNQIVVYDMYTRFYRWAMDRLTDNGIITLITNRSFIDGRAFDGFRKVIQQDFDHAYIIDTKSDVRANPKIAGTTHNIFGIQTGVAIMFLIKSSSGQLKPRPCKIEYIAMQDEWRKEEKLQWLNENQIDKIQFENVIPDANSNWINLFENDWETLAPTFGTQKNIFDGYIKGIQSKRQDWIYDYSKLNLENKIKYTIDVFNDIKNHKDAESDTRIKWSRELVRHLKNHVIINFDPNKIVRGHLKPFCKQFIYLDRHLISYVYGWDKIVNNNKNQFIVINSGSNVFFPFASNTVIDEACMIVGGGTTLAFGAKDLNSISNISDWAKELFYDYYLGNVEKKKHYSQQWRLLHPPSFSEIMEPGSEDVGDQPDCIKKIDIFYYVYAVLHHPAYRKKYEQNLRREFPRIPLYDNFPQWRLWGERLMDLHINYETVPPYPLDHSQMIPDIVNPSAYATLVKPKLKADKAAGRIIIDGLDTLEGIPSKAWEYKLGNRSALEWILDQYKEKKPSDPTIAEKFNNYRFSDHKERVIDLLKRVCTVSVETMKIIDSMEDF